MKKVFIFSSVHQWNDGRIFYREAKTLTQYFNVELHAVSNFKHKQINGIDVYGLPPWRKPLHRVKTLWLLWKRISNSNADVYHFHDPELLLLVPLIKLLKRRPIIYDVHEDYPLIILEKEYIPVLLRKLVSWFYKLYEKIVLNFIDRVFYTTRIIGERYLKRIGERAIQINNVPMIEMFKQEPLPLIERPFKAVFLGNMTPIRGIREIINAFSIVHTKYPDFCLDLIGPFYREEFKKEIMELILKLKLEKVVKIMPPITYDQIVSTLQNYRIGYITYLSYPNNMVCMPNKIFEYMACGMNIIASNFPNYREVLEQCNCGLLVEPEDVQAIADATLKYIQNNKLSIEMAAKARLAFINQFNWEIEKKKFIQVYHQI